MSQVRAVRYVTPLREGGSLPGIVEADDDGTYVVKFVGAGQGPRVLAAESIVAGLAALVDVPVPRLVAIDLSREIARFEADEEVQDLLTASVGLNLGVDFLPGAFGLDPTYVPDADLAARVLWLDAYVANVDRTWRNPNALLWHGRPWMIDHGAALYFHHGWGAGSGDPRRFAQQPYDVGGHIFAPYATGVSNVHDGAVSRLTPEVLSAVLVEVPDAWLPATDDRPTPEAVREAYVEHLLARLAEPDTWLPRPEGGVR